MLSLAKLLLDGKKNQVKTGLNLGVKGYENMRLDGKVLVGSGWIVVTKENMSDYDS